MRLCLREDWNSGRPSHWKIPLAAQCAGRWGLRLSRPGVQGTQQAKNVGFLACAELLPSVRDTWEGRMNRKALSRPWHLLFTENGQSTAWVTERTWQTASSVFIPLHRERCVAPISISQAYFVAFSYMLIITSLVIKYRSTFFITNLSLL